MQLAWLEKLATEGHVSQQARAAIYRDCSTLLKTATVSGKTQAEYTAEAAEFMTKHKKAISLGVSAAGALGAYIGTKMFGKVVDARALTKAQEDIVKTREAIIRNPEFQSHQEKATARFNELAKIAPTVARNPDLSLRILKEKVHSGFSSNDIQNLAMIQAAYTPDMKRQMRLSEGVKTAAAERTGESLAAVIWMCKEAGLQMKTLGRAATNALVLSTIPILGGVGVGAVKHISDLHDKKKMNARLNASFEKALAMSDPDKDGLHENKELARQAFQVLAHFSPHVALEPNAAKGFMKKLVAWSGQGPQVEDIKNLTEIERNVRQSAGGSPFFAGLAEGSKALGLGESLRASVNPLSGPLGDEVAAMAAMDLNLPKH